jgi:hypothetical protein
MEMKSRTRKHAKNPSKKRAGRLRLVAVLLAISVVGLLTVGIIKPFTSTPATVTVTTNSANYTPGQTVTIMILTSGSVNDTMELYLDQPDSHNLIYAYLGSGSQNYTFTLPDSAQVGTWTVTVTWDHEFARTTFTVSATAVPEYPGKSAATILALAIIMALGVLRIRRNW